MRCVPNRIHVQVHDDAADFQRDRQPRSHPQVRGYRWRLQHHQRHVEARDAQVGEHPPPCVEEPVHPPRVLVHTVPCHPAKHAHGAHTGTSSLRCVTTRGLPPQTSSTRRRRHATRTRGAGRSPIRRPCCASFKYMHATSTSTSVTRLGGVLPAAPAALDGRNSSVARRGLT